jgi:hypothetical protein
MLSIGTIVGDAFRLIGERFGSVLVWGLLYSLGAFALGYFMMSLTASMMVIDENTGPSLALGAFGSFFGRLMLVYLAFICLYNVLLTAAQRAVLRPEEGGFAYLRLGGDELRQIGLSIIIGLLFVLVYVIALFVLGIIAVVAGVGGGMSAPGEASGAGVGLLTILGLLVIFCLMMFLWVRLSLAFPLTLLRGRIILGEAWRLSRGHFWTLFGAYLVLMLIVFGLTIAISLLLQGDYWALLMQGGDAADPVAMQSQMEAQYSPGVPMILNLLFGVVIGGGMIALTGGALASAARALTGGDARTIADTFA